MCQCHDRSASVVLFNCFSRKLTQLLIPEEMIRGHSGIEIFAAERNVLRFLEIEPIPIADLHPRLLTEQHSRLVAVAVHNFDFTVFAQRLGDDRNADALDSLVALIGDDAVIAQRSDDAGRKYGKTQKQHDPVLQYEAHCSADQQASGSDDPGEEQLPLEWRRCVFYLTHDLHPFKNDLFSQVQVGYGSDDWTALGQEANAVGDVFACRVFVVIKRIDQFILAVERKGV